MILRMDVDLWVGASRFISDFSFIQLLKMKTNYVTEGRFSLPLIVFVCEPILAVLDFVDLPVGQIWVKPPPSQTYVICLS